MIDEDRMQGEKRTFLRFLLAGGSATIVDYLIYWLLSIKIHFNIAKGISMCVSCIYSFFLNKRFTFQDKRKVSFGHVGRYLLSQIANIGTNISINALVYGWTDSKFFGMICATGAAMIVNFLLQRFLVFCPETQI